MRHGTAPGRRAARLRLDGHLRRPLLHLRQRVLQRQTLAPHALKRAALLLRLAVGVRKTGLQIGSSRLQLSHALLLVLQQVEAPAPPEPAERYRPTITSKARSSCALRAANSAAGGVAAGLGRMRSRHPASP